MIEKQLTDIHCHILPAIDDGAKDIDASLKLLEEEYKNGVRQIVFTSHFDFEKVELLEFINRRKKAFIEVKKRIEERYPEWDDLILKLGAEVKFTPNLVNTNLEELCIAGTSYLLMELPENVMPAYLYITVHNMVTRGITPIIAHVERYRYIINNPTLLCEWIDEGMVIQMNAEAFINRGKNFKLLFNMVKWNLVHVIASDAHSIHRRPVNLKQGLELISKHIGNEFTDRLIVNSDIIFNDHNLEQYEMYCPRKILGRWR